MCTAISDKMLFGRTLDLEQSLGESVIITPSSYKLSFLYQPPIHLHNALIGIGIIREGKPLYYDAVNSTGLAAAALNFPDNAVYHEHRATKKNVASFELIPWLLSQCRDISDATALLSSANIVPDAFCEGLPASPLHWLIADKSRAIVVESTREGLNVYDAPLGVLTNNPPFPYHLLNISNYMQLSPAPPQNKLYPSVKLGAYSRGMGALGLPGDFSSTSRFVRAVFAKSHTQAVATEDGQISRFFHVMGTVNQPNGCALTDKDKPVRTVYTSCACLESSTYYFTTYDCRRIRAVRLKENETGERLSTYPLAAKEDIDYIHTAPYA